MFCDVHVEREVLVKGKKLALFRGSNLSYHTIRKIPESSWRLSYNNINNDDLFFQNV